MTEHVPSRLAKWPFFVSDLLLLSLAAVTIYQAHGQMGMWQAGLCLLAVSWGAWIALIPYLQEFRASAAVAEANALSTAVAQLKNIEQVRTQINQATSQWGTVQDECGKTVQSAKLLVDRMKAEAREFCSFFEKMNQSEKTHLRLEVEKLKRAEGEWLQVTVRILDHIYALNQAGARSGQPALMSQLNQFQNACRDAVRRLGLVQFTAARETAFDPKAHQLLEGQADASPNSQIADTLAPGYTYQSQLIRKALVSLRPENQPELPLALHEGDVNGTEIATPQRVEVTEMEPTVQSRESAASIP